MTENGEKSAPRIRLGRVVGKRAVPCIILKQDPSEADDGTLSGQEISTRSDPVFEMEEVIVEGECRDGTMEFEHGTTYYISEMSIPDSEELHNDHLYYSPDPDDNENSETEGVCRYSIEQFKDDEKGILYFTGLDSYGKFIAIFHTLGNNSHEMDFEESQPSNLSAENKLFLTLWKLRRNCEDYELGKHFGISKETMRTIFKKMILFMVSKFSLLDIWPTPEFMQPYIPQGSELNYFPATGNIGRSVILTNLENYVKKNIKKFRILSQKLHPAYSHLGTEITGICIILCAFMEIIKA
ncbi:hypothetical protein QAD02_019257 [Eretmocerus hayati]|uniref:Uncharacterized protein n=1 Tax=Eretmocerus hayati TaxID=131215 RepID=A0ACC2PJ69_9HYME|nr:hypothetical protein QAD02_019257 [Eretmocerus hayati]